MNRVSAGVLFLICTYGTSWAQQGPLQAGEYLDGLGGYLVIKPESGGAAAFRLHTVGGNQHICDAEGVVQKNRQAVLKSQVGAAPCTLHFEQKKDGVEVSLKKECVGFCGARATLDGMFRRPEAGCERAGVTKARGEFKRLYDKKAYAQARGIIEPVLKRCEKTLDSREEGWIRNDLALTYHHLGDPGACRKTLEPLVEDAGKSDAKIREELPPNEADTLVRIARAARTNLKLCQK